MSFVKLTEDEKSLQQVRARISRMREEMEFEARIRRGTRTHYQYAVVDRSNRSPEELEWLRIHDQQELELYRAMHAERELVEKVRALYVLDFSELEDDACDHDLGGDSNLFHYQLFGGLRTRTTQWKPEITK